MKRLTAAINEFLGALPSTNFRIFITMGLVVMTTLRYLVSGLGVSTHGLHIDEWTPTGEWLLFLTGLAGIDVAQFGVKRGTQKDPPKPDSEDVAALRGTE